MEGKLITRRDIKIPLEKTVAYHDHWGGGHEFLSSEIFDDKSGKSLILSRILRNGLLAVLQSGTFVNPHGAEYSMEP